MESSGGVYRINDVGRLLFFPPIHIVVPVSVAPTEFRSVLVRRANVCFSKIFEKTPPTRIRWASPLLFPIVARLKKGLDAITLRMSTCIPTSLGVDLPSLPLSGIDLCTVIDSVNTRAHTHTQGTSKSVLACIRTVQPGGIVVA